MRNYIIIFFCLLVFTSCHEKVEKKETIREFLSKNFRISQLDSSFVIDSVRSYINDTLESSIVSMVITKPNNILGADELKRLGYLEIQQYIDPLENITSVNTITLKIHLPFRKVNGIDSTFGIFGVPIEFKKRKNLLMNPVNIDKGPLRIAIYDTLENEYYYFKSAFFKRGIF